MGQFKFRLAVLLFLILAGCGAGTGDVSPKPKFTSQVSFGDSLSDVGSYRVSTLGSPAANVGQFTINAASGVATNWTELSSIKLGLTAPCAAATGGFGVTRSAHAGCFGYAQGGARVTSAAGYGNIGASGPMTEPVVTQIANHLSVSAGSKFSGNEIVFVMAGANDVFVQAATVVDGPTQVAAVTAVRTAASELAAAVKTQIIAKGANYVVVVNIPDIARTPQVTLISDPTTRTQTGALLDALVTAFNNQLKADLPDSAIVLNVDAYSASKDEVANPGKYNLTNVTGTACNLTSPSPNPLASSLVCNADNLNAGVSASDHYMFADKVHPTPYAHSLFSLYVLQAMTNKGWY